MIELMMVITIIGVLASIAIPMYLVYRAKGRTLEAKIVLGNLYTNENTFYISHRSYVSCLNFIGFNPGVEFSQRYYAVGFENKTAAANEIITDRGIIDANCSDSGWHNPSAINPPPAYHGYEAGENGGTTLAHVEGKVPPFNTPRFDPDGNDIVTADGQNFQAMAAGKVSFFDSDGLDVWIIDDTKELKHRTVGY